MRCIQPEERQRIRKFRYRKDAKASIVGRLLMRFWAIKTFQASNEAIIFDRSDRGRPRLLLKEGETWTFNVSHAGNYTVFVAQRKCKCVFDNQNKKKPCQIGDWHFFLRNFFLFRYVYIQK